MDEQTGRIMEGRRYSDGLHQAIEAKEGVKVEAATQTFATITLQNYFRMYHKLAGMTGTAETEAGEFWDIYKLDVVTIPTNKPVARIDMNDRVYRTKRENTPLSSTRLSALSAKGVRYSWAQLPSKYPSCCPVCYKCGAYHTTCSTPNFTRKKPRLWLRQVEKAPLP